MKSKTSKKNKICSNCNKLIVADQRYFYSQNGKNFTIFCLTCFFEKSMNDIIEISKNLRDQMRS